MQALHDEHIGHAISNLRRRSERQDDIEKLRSSFVDVGILQQLQNDDNQIIYGRRGTGKTHVLKMLASQASGPNKTACYIDFRTLGSTAQFSDDSLGIRRRCTCLFRDVLATIHDTLLEHFLGGTGTLSEEAGILLDRFADAAVSEVRSYRETVINLQEHVSNDHGNKIGISLTPSPKLDVEIDSRRTSQMETNTTTQITNEDKVIFPGINSLLAQLLGSEKARLLLLMDEWSSLPWDIQPYLAEFLKRAFFSNPSVTTKIASLEQRSNFVEHKASTIVGFEVGSDISASLDIDDYYVFEKDPENVTAAFADILFKHIRNELPYQYLEARYAVQK